MPVAPALAFLSLAPAVVPPPPPVVVHTPVAATQQGLIAWLPGAVSCAGRPVEAARMQRPWTGLHPVGEAPEPVRYRFAIDGAGRPLSIARVDGPAGARYIRGGEDIAPAFAATRFAPGAPQRDCEIVYRARVTALADTPVEDLVSYSLTPLTGPLPRAGWDRIGGGADCLVEPRPAPLTLSIPDWRTIPGTPGVKPWSLFGYDLDAEGRPRNVAVVAGTGDPALDRAGVRAIAGSRYTGGPRTGCRHPYWRNVETLPAPGPAPSTEAYRPAGATCPAEPGFATPPRVVFPESWRRRAIEGWAIIAYDAAPWGEIGNIRVLAAEPSDEFGQAAERIVRTARLRPSDGWTGCVDRFVFRMAGAPAPEGAAVD